LLSGWRASILAKGETGAVSLHDSDASDVETSGHTMRNCDRQ
jgi:hypothetical protein